MQSAAARRPRVRWRTLALPNEHGAWAFVLEPGVLGLGAAPSAAGLAVLAAGVGALLAQHPLSLALADLRRRRRFPRTLPALALAGGYGVLAVGSVLAAVALGARREAFVPLLAAAPAALMQLAFDARNRGRDARAELAGAVALGALAAAIVLAAGDGWRLALPLWLVCSARGVPSILYVRARLRLQRGQAAGRWGAGAASAGALAAVAALAAAGGLPWLAAAPFVLLTARAWRGLRRGARALAAKTVGMAELAFGLGTVALVLIGLWTGL